MGLHYQVIVMALSFWLLLAAAARVEPQAKLLQAAVAAGLKYTAKERPPNTYYFDVSKPVLGLSSRGSGRAGRTALTVTLSEASVSKYMPVVTPRASGMVHFVSNTWSSLKGLGTMFMHANGIEANPAEPRLFPCTILAVEAADDNAAVKPDVSNIIQAAEAHRRRNLWTETSPSSALLLPVGQSTGAVADLLDVSYDAKADTVTLEVDLVHDPHTMSEFEHHGKQTLDVDQAHYHFLTGPGVKVDAQALIKSLQDTQFAVEGMHVFFKNGRPPTCYGVNLTSSTDVADVGQTINVTVTLDGSNCTSRTPSDATAPIPPEVTTASIPQEEVDKYNIILRLLLVGPGQWDQSSDRCEHSECFQKAAETNPSLQTGPGSRRGSEDAGINVIIRNGVGWATFAVVGTGPISVLALEQSDRRTYYVPNIPGAYLFFNVEGQCSGIVSSLVLTPDKAYRHVHDSVTFTVLALDADGVAVSGASVTLSVFGDCEPSQFTDTVITGADGTASVVLTSKIPGFASVVAVALDANGAPVISAPAHVIFYKERHGMDYHEERYYSRGGYAQTYAAAATRAAVQQISQKLVSQTN